MSARDELLEVLPERLIEAGDETSALLQREARAVGDEPVHEALRRWLDGKPAKVPRDTMATIKRWLRSLLPQISRELFRFDLAFPLDGPDAGLPRFIAGFQSEL